MTSRPLRVMLVEDSALMVRELTSALRELGPVEVTAVASSEDMARGVLRGAEATFDVLVVDVFLVKGSGLGVVRAARALDLPSCIVVLTNFATLDVRKRCVALGADRVFDKSKQLDEFLDYIGALANPDATPEPVDALAPADTMP